MCKILSNCLNYLPAFEIERACKYPYCKLM